MRMIENRAELSINDGKWNRRFFQALPENLGIVFAGGAVTTLISLEQLKPDIVTPVFLTGSGIVIGLGALAFGVAGGIISYRRRLLHND